MPLSGETQKSDLGWKNKVGMGVKAGDTGESCGCAGEVRCEDKGVILEDVGNINIRLGGSTVVLNRALLWV